MGFGDEIHSEYQRLNRVFNALVDAAPDLKTKNWIKNNFMSVVVDGLFWSEWKTRMVLETSVKKKIRVTNQGKE